MLALVLAVLRPGFFGRPAETWPGEGVPLPYENERVVEWLARWRTQGDDDGRIDSPRDVAAVRGVRGGHQ